LCGAAVRIVIAEDSALLRDGLVRMLEANGHQVVASVGDAAELVNVVGADGPDLVVLDVRMPPTHTDEGIRAALELRTRWPELAVLVLSQYIEENYATDLLSGDLGGIAYVLKDRVTDVSDFLETVDRVGAGGTVIDPEVVSQLLARTRRREPLEDLSPREREVLALMAEGRSNVAIAEKLVVTQRAVEKHVKSIFQKLRLPQAETDHRRVLAVLRYLEAR
ncbi:MAG TPA: response regulator transcription factor, partial [Thermoleophilaceae bacterium]